MRDYRVYFECDPNFIKSDLEISPVKLPLSSRLQVYEYHLFEGLSGIFNDSLLDGWGDCFLIVM